MQLKDYVSQERGRLTRLAEAVSRKPPYISHLVAGRKPVPVVLAIEIERATGGAVTRYDLRQDADEIWPRDKATSAL
ncbi:helix-turn-helix domain-containing protein [Laribacter hongkongensis]|uniref:transcriptional regulator n=1 Tax=Laribacter hongkongensis TaxID=168471 RepID=UPI002835E279|nr:helix-turn-helix domain-containing protein [Laribacter hongkongensis]MCG9051476.1 helix-turn-helix domain-containing protein [Laribacter hongkongensis]